MQHHPYDLLSKIATASAYSVVVPAPASLRLSWEATAGRVMFMARTSTKRRLAIGVIVKRDALS